MRRAIVALGIALALGACGGRAPARAAPSSPTNEPVALPGADDPIPAPVDTDGDGLDDADDACPLQPIAMSGDCPPERRRGCPDDCRPPTMVEP